MSSNSYGRMLNVSPQVNALVDRVVTAMRTLPSKPGIDPIVLAHEANLDRVSTLAALGALTKARLGEFAVQILNPRGQAVAEFPSVDETPASVLDDYGEMVDVTPTNMRIVFRPAPSVLDSRAR